MNKFYKPIKVIKLSLKKCLLEILINTCVLISFLIISSFFDYSSAFIYVVIFIIYFYAIKIIVHMRNFIMLLNNNIPIELYEDYIVIKNFVCEYKSLKLNINHNFLLSTLTFSTDLNSIDFYNYFNKKDYNFLLSKTNFVSFNKNEPKPNFVHINIDKKFIIIICITILLFVFFMIGLLF